jgi:D-alanyl-lipoteichoic acid acyltransferase DltB (MBOAT superfamily)
MSFTAWYYPFFLGGVGLLYWRLPGRARIGLILGASYVFYGVWDARFLALLLTSTVIDYYGGLAMVGQREPLGRVVFAAALPGLWLAGYTIATGRTDTVAAWILGAAATFPLLFPALYTLLWGRPPGLQRRAFLILSVLTNLTVLGFFKYFNFFAGSLLDLLAALGWQPGWTLPRIILPVAISFYTFQSISYAVEIYRGRSEPVRDALTFAAYLAFFPQLVSGPIERPYHLVPQFLRPAAWSVEDFHWGLRSILVGLFKKVFVADNCALLANYAFDPKTPLTAPWALLGILAFAFQIYGDFSGYTDIARGSGRLLGFRLSQNFRFPYFARSGPDFWARWHITFSTWLRDYIFFVLPGNRQGTVGPYVNLVITFLIGGLWHGASWMFVLWGAYQGILLVLYRAVPALRRLAAPSDRPTWRVPASMILMFVLTLLGWVVFRCQDPGVLAGWFAALGQWHRDGAAGWVQPAYWLLVHVLPLLALQALAWRTREETELDHLPWGVRGVVYLVLTLAVLTSSGADVEFLYFQF